MSVEFKDYFGRVAEVGDVIIYTVARSSRVRMVKAKIEEIGEKTTARTRYFWENGKSVWRKVDHTYPFMRVVVIDPRGWDTEGRKAMLKRPIFVIVSQPQLKLPELPELNDKDIQRTIEGR